MWLFAFVRLVIWDLADNQVYAFICVFGGDCVRLSSESGAPVARDVFEGGLDLLRGRGSSAGVMSCDSEWLLRSRST